MDVVMNLNPSSILDVGAGFGKYGVLCREYLELWDGRQNYRQFLRRIDGVEAFESYITPLHRFIYDHIYVQDILLLVDKLDYRYDLALLVDVLEHFTKADGNSLLKKMLSNNRGVLISTPKKPSNQKALFGNSYETHRARWTKQELSGFANSLFVSDNTQLMAYLGKKEAVDTLKSRLILPRIKRVPGIQFISQSYFRTRRKVAMLYRGSIQS
jgi:hypothetical protein